MNETNKKNTEPVRKSIRKPAIIPPSPDNGKLPPQAIDLEESVLGALMLESDAITTVIDILHVDVFYKESHQKIFNAILSLFHRKLPVDILTVTSELKRQGTLDEVGGPLYVSQLTNRIASAANVEYHARILSQKFIQRELIRISSEVIKDAYEDNTDVFDLLDAAESKIFAISENHLRREYKSMASLIMEALERIKDIRNSGTDLSGVPSGFSELDRITAGWQPSDLVIVAARPGMGKTAFVLTMARNIAVDRKLPVAIFSLEMSALQLVTRLIAAETHIHANKLRKGDLKDYEWEALNVKIKALAEAQIFIDDTPALSVFELRAKCRRLKYEHNVSLVIVDYLQLMSGGSDAKGNREQEISNISRSLKSLAKELNVPVIALSQLSRAVETRGGSKKPILSDLRESGAIEQDADLVLFIYRPEYYKIAEDEDGNSTNGMADIIIAKHRNGIIKDIKLRFVNEFAKFEELEPVVYLNSNDKYSAPPASYTIPSKMNDEDNDTDPF